MWWTRWGSGGYVREWGIWKKSKGDWVQSVDMSGSGVVVVDVLELLSVCGDHEALTALSHSFIASDTHTRYQIGK